MEQNILQGQMKEIVKIIFEHCDKISRVNYCRAYKWALGEEVPVKVLNGVLYKIGAGKYIYNPRLKKERIIAIVSTGNGKEGMVFTFDGIYYREGFMDDTQFKEYGECHSFWTFNQFSELFSSSAIDEMFAQFQKVLH